MNNANRPDQTSPFQLATSPGGNQLVLSAMDPRLSGVQCIVNTVCNITMAVNWTATPGFSSSAPTYYRVSATPSTTSYNLTDGNPLTRTVAPGGTAYFAYTPYAPSTVNLDLTVFSGSAALYVRNGAFPAGPGAASSWGLNSTQEGGAVAILPSDPAYNPPATPPYPTFYLTVQGDNTTGASTTFSISAFTTPPGGALYNQSLVDGRPQTGTTPAHTMSYYVLDNTAALAAQTNTLDVYAARDSGSPVEIYITPIAPGGPTPPYPLPVCKLTDPTTQQCQAWGATAGSYNATSEGSGRPGFVSLFTTNGPLAGTYLISVLANLPDRGSSDSRPATFTITGSTGVYGVQLQAGAPFPGAVRSVTSSSGGTKYFSYTPSTPNSDMVVNVEVASGSLEVYVLQWRVLGGSNAPINAFVKSTLPGPGNSQWDSTAQGGSPQRNRFVRIPFSALDPACQTSINLGLGLCGLSIGVAGGPTQTTTGRATFTIAASQSGSPSSPLLLPQGASEYVSIPANGCVYLSGIPGSGRVTGYDYLYASNQVGAATMYVNYRTPSFYTPGAGLFPDSVNNDLGGYELFTAPRDSANYQNLYITLCANTGGGSEHVVTFRTNYGVTPLDNNERTLVALPACIVSNATNGQNQCFPSIYSISVSDASASIAFTIERSQGSVNAYISNAVPGSPWVLPSPDYYDWTFYPTFFSPTFTIPPTDSKLCQITPTNPTCVYYIALYPAAFQPATAWLTVTTEANPITVLYDGAPVSGQVYDGSLAYFSYRPATAGIPAPPVSFAWSNLFGAVALYVTNSYNPLTSPLSALPGPASTSPCQWVCANFTACYALPGDACYTPTGPGGAALVYTVGVLGASGIAVGALNEYSLTASNAGDPVQLTVGLPTTDIVLFPYTNTTFVVELEGSSYAAGDAVLYDVLFSASVNHGEVYMMVAPAFAAPGGAGTAPPPPACAIPAFGGTLLSCSGAVWSASNGAGDPVIYLSADPNYGQGVCAPIAPTGTPTPAVDSTLCTSYFGRGKGAVPQLLAGRYYVTLYAQVQTELSLLVQTAGVDQAVVPRGGGTPVPVPARAVPRTILADGQPLFLQTGPITMCPGVVRSNVTEACPPNSTATLSYPTTGSFSIFRAPGASASMAYMNVIVERLCGGNATGECGPQMYLSVGGCPADFASGASNCTPTDLTPYLGDAAFALPPMWQAVTGFRIPYNICYAAGYTPGPGAPPPDCLYAFGVFPYNGPNGAADVPGLVASSPQTFRITLSTPGGTQRIPQDCPGAGRLCVLPEQSVAPGGSRYYESYASSNSADGIAVTLAAQLCYGSSLSLAVCIPGALGGSACATPARPGSAGSRDYDLASTFDPITGLATFPNRFVAPGDLYYFAVSGPGVPGQLPPLDAPGYELQLQHDDGLLLSRGTSQLTATWDPTSTFLTVAWRLPTLTYTGTGVRMPLANAYFYLHAFLLGTAYAPFQPATPCGLEVLRRANLTGAVTVAFAQADACGQGGGDANACSVTFTPPSTQFSYQLALAAVCAAQAWPPGNAPCMPRFGESQTIAWPTILDYPAPVPVSPTATARPQPTAAPAPSGGGAAAAAPSIVGPVVGGLLGVAALVGAAYAAYAMGVFSPGGAGAVAYSKLSAMVGGGGEGKSGYSPARESLVDHPIFGGGSSSSSVYAPPGAVASADAEYSQLA